MHNLHVLTFPNFNSTSYRIRAFIRHPPTKNPADHNSQTDGIQTKSQGAMHNCQLFIRNPESAIARWPHSLKIPFPCRHQKEMLRRSLTDSPRFRHSHLCISIYSFSIAYFPAYFFFLSPFQDREAGSKRAFYRFSFSSF